MNVQTKPAEDAAAIVAELGARAKAAAVALRNAGTEAKNKALAEGARLIRAEQAGDPRRQRPRHRGGEGRRHERARCRIACC